MAAKKRLKRIWMIISRKPPSEIDEIVEQRFTRVVERLRTQQHIVHSTHPIRQTYDFSEESPLQDYYDTVLNMTSALQEQGFVPETPIPYIHTDTIIPPEEYANLLNEFTIAQDHGFVLPLRRIKTHPMDKKYPHTCFKCGKSLRWTELLSSNGLYKHGGIRDNIYEQYKHFKKLWRSKVIQFYCCLCYNRSSF